MALQAALLAELQPRVRTPGGQVDSESDEEGYEESMEGFSEEEEGLEGEGASGDESLEEDDEFAGDGGEEEGGEDAKEGEPGNEESGEEADVESEAESGEEGAAGEGQEGEGNSEGDDEGSGEEEDPAERKKQAFAKAFAKILDAGAHPKAGILTASKSVRKRKREEAVEAKSDKEHRNVRTEMRRRGHVAVLKAGEDPESDGREKLLLRIATRGVVRMFNAVNTAQRGLQEDTKKPVKAAPLARTSFLAELRSKQGEAEAGGIKQEPAEGNAGGSGWNVLSGALAGLQGGAGLRLKDWDKQEDSESEPDAPQQRAIAAEADSDDDNNAW